MSHVPQEERRRQLIDAAVRVISREGPARATTRRIALEADAPLASLHYSFRNKEELFHAVIDYCQEVTRQRYGTLAMEGAGLYASVHALVEQFRVWTMEDPDFLIAQNELIFWALRNPRTQEFAAEIYTGYFEVVHTFLADSATAEDDLDALDDLVRDVVAVIDGMILQIIAMGAQGPSALDVDRYTRSLLAGMALPSV